MRYDEAARYYQDAVRMDPCNADALSGLGGAFVEIGRYDEAHHCFGSALEIDPGHPAALAGMGDLCMKMSAFAEAVNAYDAAISADPGQRNPHAGRGEALKNLGRLKEASKSFTMALRIEPDDVTSLYMLGECMFAVGRTHDALHLFRRVHDMSPATAAVAMYNMAGCLSELGRHKEAIASFERALKYDDEDWDSMLGIGSSLAAMGRGDAAIEEFDFAADNGPEDIAAQALLLKSRLLEDMKRSDDAMSACDMVVEIAGCNTEAMLRKGRILARSGRRLAALSCIAAAKNCDPSHKRAVRDAAAVTKALEREGKLPWMWMRSDGGNVKGRGRGTRRRRGMPAKNEAGGAASNGTGLASAGRGRSAGKGENKSSAGQHYGAPHDSGRAISTAGTSGT